MIRCSSQQPSQDILCSLFAKHSRGKKDIVTSALLASRAAIPIAIFRISQGLEEECIKCGVLVELKRHGCGEGTLMNVNCAAYIVSP